ncbi:MAG TPA: hypothetical protein VMN60_13185 [Longimicrobiales bacterium]|nr:hypothetical protein [Longimicrobiales bacterium]
MQRQMRRLRDGLRLLGAAALLSAMACATATTTTAPGGGAPAQPDPRLALSAGWTNAGAAARHMALIGHADRPQGFVDPSQLGNILLANSDMAFRGNLLFMGNFNGFQIWDVTNPRVPQLRTAFVCPGGQGDLSVYGNLLFMSVEMPNGRIDCRAGPLTPQANPNRFLGVRIFDISDIARPRQIAAVQTCRGSHTHTLVTNASDRANVYIYVQGTSQVRPASELAGCVNAGPEDPNTARFRIEVIQVPLAAPQNARIVNTPRIFANPQTGNVGGLWPGGAHGPGTQTTSTTDQCHDITAYPEIGLAAGACSGNGIVLNIADPANPVRIDEVVDPNFAYWHSATFNNDGSKIIFTDEWGGGTLPRCRASDRREWGANAIFDRVGGRLQLRSYYKLPVVQSTLENCVAHNGSLVPVPGRDIMVQAWYQGGVSVFDFTDSANPFEIAFFDRGPLSPTAMLLGGMWSAYWYNGLIYGSEIARGLDIFELQPSEHLTQNEIDAARLVRWETFNPQTQPKAVWPAEFVVARAYIDQLRRANAVSAGVLATLSSELDRIERIGDAAARRSALAQLSVPAAAGATGVNAQRLTALAQVLRDIGR